MFSFKTEVPKIDSDCKQCLFIFLNADKKIVTHRLASRKNHFMAYSLINSQCVALEIPKSGFILDATESFENNVDIIIKYTER